MPKPPRPAGGLSAFAWWSPFAAALVALIVTVVAVGLISIVVEATGTRLDADDLPPGITIGGTLVQDLALIGAAVLFAGVGGVRPSAAAFGIRRTRFWKAVGLAVAAAVTFYVFSLIWAVALGIDEKDDLPGELGAKDSALNFAAVAFMVCMAAPLAEEFFFRGFCFPALATILGWVGGAVATGIIFGAIHIGGTKAVFLVPLMVLGFLLCVLYKLTGSILPCIAVHAVNNGAALSVFMEFEVWEGAIAVVAAPIACMLVAVPLTRRRARPALA
jgi:membrane protease YdiL (CAAX protease family)